MAWELKSMLLAALVCPTLAFCQDAMNTKEDLLTPRIKEGSSADTVSFWYKDAAERNCSIQDVSLDGTTVTFSTDSGEFKAVWTQLPAGLRKELQPKYDQYFARKQREVAEARDRDLGIGTITGKVISVDAKGILIAVEDRNYLLVGYPGQKTVADGDDIGPVRVQTLPDTYSYPTLLGEQATVHELKYAGETQ